MNNKVILIDKLNLITFFISVLYFKTKTIFFTKTDTASEKTFISLLKFLKKSFKFDVVNYDDNPAYFKNIQKNTFEMAKIGIADFNKDDFLHYFCRFHLYYGLFKVNEIEVFYYKKYDVKYVFVNYVNVLKNLEHLNNFQKKIKFYTWFNLRLNDLPDSSLDKKSLDKRIKDKVKWLLILFKIKLFFQEPKHNINTLYCSDRTYKNNETNNVYKNFDEGKDAFLNILTNKIYFKGQEISLYSLEIMSVYSYISFVLNCFLKYKSFFNKYKVVSLYDQFYIFKNMYFVKKLIDKSNVKISFSIHETLLVTIINDIVSKSNNGIAVTATWSLRVFPLFDNGFNKQADINSIWGDFQKEVFTNSLDNSKYYVQNGYLGDFAVEYFKKQSKKYEALDYIVLYDNVFYDDLLITQKQIYEFIATSLSFCRKNNLKLIIKTKYEKTFRDYMDLKYLAQEYRDTIIFEYGRADLTPVFNAKIALGISNSSLVNIAGCWGVPSILYDKFDLINEANISKNCFVAKNIIELEDKLNLLYTQATTCGIDRDSRIDPFVDGKALERIYEYINELQAYNGTKEEKIEYANNRYRLKYGQDKVAKNV